MVETAITDILINATITAANGGGTEQILDNIITLLFGGSATVIAIWQYLKKMKILDYLNFNSATTTPPSDIIKAEAKGALITSMSQDDINKILKTCTSDFERQSVEDYIKSKQKTDYEFKVSTSTATFTIEQGFITKTESLTDKTSINSDHEKIGLCTVISTTLNGAPLKDGNTYTIQEILEKTLTTKLKGEDYGNVIIGLYYDDKLIHKGDLYSKPDSTEIVSGKTFDHNSDYIPGHHIISVKQGYLDGYNLNNGKNKEVGDVTTWKDELTVSYNITVVE